MATIRTETQPKSGKKASRFPRLLESIFSSTTGQHSSDQPMPKDRASNDQRRATDSDLLHSRQQNGATPVDSLQTKPKTRSNSAKRTVPARPAKASANMQQKSPPKAQRNEPWSQASIILYDRQLRVIKSLIKEVEKTTGRNVPRSEMVRVLLDLNFEPQPNQPEIKNLTGLRHAVLLAFKG